MNRFWSKVDTFGDCWEWTASKYVDGYGQFRHDGRPQRAHRVAYELVIGPIPEGLVIDHLCRNKGCVNPAHLEAVTPGENTRRGEAAARLRALRAAQTHCKRGHEFTQENTYIHPKNGARDCRTCRSAAGRRRNQKVRTAA